MAEATAARAAIPLAVVGLACRFPDSDDPAALLDVVLTGRKSFRRLPPGRLDLNDYYQPDQATSDATYSTRAAVIEGWRFDCAAFGVEPAAYLAADPAHWLALETTARALAAAGLPAGTGLDRDRTGVIIGNTLAGDTSRANALRVRWPYVRRVLSEALGTQEIPSSQAGGVLRQAESKYLAPFPVIGPDTLAGSMPGTIAASISSYFGFRGGSHVVDSACSSSLQAVASACSALAAGELDAAIAGGVDLSLDPLELIGLARAGVLATADVRIYDQNPTGHLPGEGCGVVVLMRSADARTAGLPVYAEILGWGTSAGATPGEPQSHASSQLLAMQRAYERAAVDPADIQFIEGNGAGTAADDEAELAALSVLRAGARHSAALGSVKANIGHAKAAAGAAALIKTVLALGTGVVPPASGVGKPHALIATGDARIVLPPAAREWAEGTRLASVSTMGIGGSNVHVVLRHEPAGRARQERWLRSVPVLARSSARAEPGRELASATVRREAMAFLLHAPDRFALASVLSRLADIAGWLSDAEMLDLACLLGRDTAKQGPAKVGLVAARQDQLAMLAREAVSLLPRLADGLVAVRPGIFAADDADGRVTLLLSGEQTAAAGQAAAGQAVAAGLADPGSEGRDVTAAVVRCLDTLRWLESMDVQATGAVGHGIGALAGLAWSGVLGESEVVDIADLRAQFLRRSAIENRAAVTAHAAGEAGRAPGTGRADSAALRAAIAQRFRFGPPRRRLISTMTGAELSSVDDAIDLICSGFSGAEKLGEAIADGAVGATLLLETGPGRTLATAAAGSTRVPAVSLRTGPADPVSRARAAAALFAAGALGQPLPLFAGLIARPIDIWREQVFITNPCQVAPQRAAVPDANIAAGAAAASVAGRAAPGQVATEQVAPAQVAPAQVDPDQGADATFQAPAVQETPIQEAVQEPVRQEAAIWEPDAGEATVREAPAGQPGEEFPAEHPDRRSADDDGISGLRTEFERRLPAKALLAAAAAAAPAELAEGSEPLAAAAGEPQPAETSGLLAAQPADAGFPATPASAGAHAASLPAPDDGTAPAGSAFAACEIGVPFGQLTGTVGGIGTWARCFTEELRAVRRPARPEVARSWRIHAAADLPVFTELSALFTADPAASRTLAILGSPAEERSRSAAVQAARDAITTGELVVLTTSPGFTGFFASVHAEHPSVGITVLRIPAGAREHAAALAFAHAGPGEFRELIVGPAGSVSEPVLTELAPAGGSDFPLDTDDVVLVSRDAKGSGLVLAQVLALCGTAVAVVGRTGRNDDSELVAGLEQLRSAGARIGYEVIDMTDPASLAGAIQRIEDRLGPVTAIAHSSGQDDPVPFLDLTDAQVGGYLSGQADALDRLVASVRAGQLKLIATFGSVAGRYGMPRASLSALANGALAERARLLAEAMTGCQVMHVDLPALAMAGLGDHPELAADLAAADTAPIELAMASRLLLKIMTTAPLPAAVAVHGRVGGLASRPAPVVTKGQLAAAGLAPGGRFLRETVVHYPGIELICEARLSLHSDPYLADYLVDGMPVLPPALAIEALAQAASVLAGRPVRLAGKVAMDLPIVIPSGGEVTVRVCALRDGAGLTAALRCSESSYAVDHARAEFSLGADEQMPAPAIAGPATTLNQLTASPSGLVDGAELYGPVYFQSGRFRRVALIPELTARSCRALARGIDDQPWYPSGSELADTEFLLGSPGLNDAMLQALQACVPHRRVRPAEWESVQFSGAASDGAVEIRAIAAGPARPGTARASGRRPRSGEVALPGQVDLPGQGAAPAAERTGESVQTAPPATRRPEDMTAEERADMEVAETRPQSKRTRKHGHPQHGHPQHGRSQPASRNRRRDDAAPSYASFHTWEVDPVLAAARPDATPPDAAPSYASFHTWEVVSVPAATPAVAIPGPAEASGPAYRLSPGAALSTAPARTGGPGEARTPQLWDVEAIDASGQLLAAWRGVQLRDCGPLPRNAAWPPTLLSVFLEHSATELGLDASLRVAVSWGLPGSEDGLPLALAASVPQQSPPPEASLPGSGHAGSGQAASGQAATAAVVYAATAPGAGTLAGFSLTVRAPVPVACGWTTAESSHHLYPATGLAQAYAQLRRELAEPPELLAARLDAAAACLAAAGMAAGDEVTVARTASDGWALLEVGDTWLACAVVEMSGVSAPVALAILTAPVSPAGASAQPGPSTRAIAPTSAEFAGSA